MGRIQRGAMNGCSRVVRVAEALLERKKRKNAYGRRQAQLVERHAKVSKRGIIHRGAEKVSINLAPGGIVHGEGEVGGAAAIRIAFASPKALAR